MSTYPPYNSPPGYYPFSATPSPAGSPSGGHHGYYMHTPGPSPRHSRHVSGDAYGYSPRGAFSPRYNSSGYYATANVSPKKSSWAPPRHYERRNSFSYRASYGDSDEDEYEYVDV